MIMVREYLNIVDKAAKAHAEAVGFLESLNYHAKIDEIAMWLPHRDALLTAIMDEVVNGNTVYFNASRDRVATMPFYSAYSVEYHFLQTHDLPYRIEAMLLDGVADSPAHATLRKRINADVFPVHASWKTYTEEDYEAEEGYLRGAGFWLVQDCRSSYGHFSYWTHPHMPHLYFKPRVNLRDQESGETVEIQDGLGNVIKAVQS